ncbi:MAG: alpha/beta fold hydrolase [Cytophagaceae bacterium]
MKTPEIKNHNGFKYIDEGEGEILLLLHGLFGALSNWESVINCFSTKYRVLIPVMPIYETPIKSASVDGLVDFIEEFVKFKDLNNMTLLGNSLGGHVGLIYTLNHQEKVKKLVLTGSSGLFENSMGGSFPKRGNYDYIKERVQYTFYDPNSATKELVDEVFDIVSSIPKCMRIIAIAKSAQRHNMAKEITKIQVPTLLVWGLNDTITPPIVAHEFNRLIPNSVLRFIDNCGHAPMMENSERFNELLTEFLQEKVMA